LQFAAVRESAWHFSDLARCLRLVCYLGKSGNAPPSPIRSFSAPIDAAVSYQAGSGFCLKTRCTTLVPKFSPDLEDAVAVGLQFQDFRLYFGLNPAPAQFRSFRPLLALADVCSSG